MVTELIAAPDDAGRRLDRILRKALPDMPLSGIHRLLRKGAVSVDGHPASGADRVKAGSVIAIPKISAGRGVPGVRRPPDSGSDAVAERILWESPDILVLNKPAGVAVHGYDSLDDLVQAYLSRKIPPSLSFKPGPLHRLDKPTSGIIVFSATSEGARYFSDALQKRRLKKKYLALVDGAVTASAVWGDPLFRDRTARKTFVAGQDRGQTAETLIRPVMSAGGYSLIEAEIRTGRTHQIRAQAGFHGHPLAGDRKYGGSFQREGFLLHAYTLEFPENRPAGLPETLTAPLPDLFRRRIRELFGNEPIVSGIFG
jgi:23S rRNA pseudouridine955/2504/2580 synthase